MAEEGTDTAPVQESTEEKAKSDNTEGKAEENNAKVKTEEPSLDEAKSNDNNVDNKEKDTSDSAPKVEITEEPSNSAAGQGEQQPKPIVEEPNSNTVPQLNVIPDGSENTVITENI